MASIMTENIFTCRRCEMNLEVGHLDQPVTECPVCFWKPKPRCVPYSRGCEARYIPAAACQSPNCDCD